MKKAVSKGANDLMFTWVYMWIPKANRSQGKNIDSQVPGSRLIDQIGIIWPANN
jgi:hypothetical protein